MADSQDTKQKNSTKQSVRIAAGAESLCGSSPVDFWTLLRLTQEYISQTYAAALTDKEKLSQLKSYIEKYVRDHGYKIEGYSLKQLTDRLYCEMAEYSILTQYLGSDMLEEINSATRS